jgi:hypothetical protein
VPGDLQFLSPEIDLLGVHIGLHPPHLRDAVAADDRQPDVGRQQIDGTARVPVKGVALDDPNLGAGAAGKPVEQAELAVQRDQLGVEFDHGHRLHFGLQRA